MDDVVLEPEQEELLAAFVEAARRVPPAERTKFMVIRLMGGPEMVQHSGLPGRAIEAYFGDVEALANEDLLTLTFGPKGTPCFDVSPRGFRHYEQMKQRRCSPIQHVEHEIRSYVDAKAFRRQYPTAYEKWAQAEGLLWGSDSERQFTTIGHLCREAMQEFATALVERFQPPKPDPNKAHDVARIRAVLDHRSAQLPKTLAPFLVAILAYWGTVSDLVQRQEHGGQREGEPLNWEDGRRVVFQTAIVMYEIDRAFDSLS